MCGSAGTRGSAAGNARARARVRRALEEMFARTTVRDGFERVGTVPQFMGDGVLESGRP